MSNKYPKALSEPVTAVSYTHVMLAPTGQPYLLVERSESVRARIEKWFIDPLMKMSGSQGFLVLMGLFPLYEKHLKLNEGMQEDQEFSEGAVIFKTIGKHLHISSIDAYRFWTNFRNGLLHKALHKEKGTFRYVLHEKGPAIKVEGDIFHVNPFEVRDLLIEVIRGGLRTWKDDDVSLPVTYDSFPVSVEIRVQGLSPAGGMNSIHRSICIHCVR